MEAFQIVVISWDDEDRHVVNVVIEANAALSQALLDDARGLTNHRYLHKTTDFSKSSLESMLSGAR